MLICGTVIMSSLNSNKKSFVAEVGGNRAEVFSTNYFFAHSFEPIFIIARPFALNIELSL